MYFLSLNASRQFQKLLIDSDFLPLFLETRIGNSIYQMLTAILLAEAEPLDSSVSHSDCHPPSQSRQSQRRRPARQF